MPKRPALSDTTFLSHVFSPKKHAQPTGLRRTILKALTGGRKNTRLKSFNRMSAVNQEVLKRSGQREAYLKGQTNLAEAKRSLRPQAIALNVAKPLRNRGSIPSPTGRRTALDRMIAEHLKRTVRAEGKDVNSNTVDTQIMWLDEPTEGMAKWSYGQFKYAGRKGSEYDRFDDNGVRHNPFWYH